MHVVTDEVNCKGTKIGDSKFEHLRGRQKGTPNMVVIRGCLLSFDETNRMWRHIVLQGHTPALPVNASLDPLSLTTSRHKQVQGLCTEPDPLCDAHLRLGTTYQDNSTESLLNCLQCLENIVLNASPSALLAFVKEEASASSAVLPGCTTPELAASKIFYSECFSHFTTVSDMQYLQDILAISLFDFESSPVFAFPALGSVWAALQRLLLTL